MDCGTAVSSTYLKTRHQSTLNIYL